MRVFATVQRMEGGGLRGGGYIAESCKRIVHCSHRVRCNEPSGLMIYWIPLLIQHFPSQVLVPSKRHTHLHAHAHMHTHLHTLTHTYTYTPGQGPKYQWSRGIWNKQTDVGVFKTALYNKWSAYFTFPQGLTKTLKKKQHCLVIRWVLQGSTELFLLLDFVILYPLSCSTNFGTYLLPQSFTESSQSRFKMFILASSSSPQLHNVLTSSI